MSYSIVPGRWIFFENVMALVAYLRESVLFFRYYVLGPSMRNIKNGKYPQFLLGADIRSYILLFYWHALILG